MTKLKLVKPAKDPTPRTNRTMELDLEQVHHEILVFWGWSETITGDGWYIRGKSDTGRRVWLIPNVEGFFEEFSRLRTPNKRHKIGIGLQAIPCEDDDSKKYLAHMYGPPATYQIQNSPTPLEAITRLYHAAIKAGCVRVNKQKTAAKKTVRRVKTSPKI